MAARPARGELAAWRSLIDQLPDALCLLDSRGCVLELNRAAEELLGPDALGRDLFSHAPDWAGLEPLGEPKRFRRDASSYEALLKPLESEAGAQAAYLLTLRDISAHVSASRQLLQQAVFQEALLECSQALLEREVGTEVYQRVLAAAIRAIPGAEAGSIVERGPDGSFGFVASVGFDFPLLSQLRLEPHELYYHGALQTGQPRFAKDLNDLNARTLPADKHRLIQQAGFGGRIRASLALPVVLEGELLAVLSLDNSRDENAFDEAAQGLAEVFAKHLGAALQKARLGRQIERIAAVQALLARVERLLLESDPATGFFSRLAELLLGAPDLKLDQLVIYERQRGRRFGAYVHARQAEREKAVAEALERAGLLSDWEQGDNLLRLCAEGRRILYLEDVFQEARWIRLEANPSRTVLYCPLLRHGEIWGVIEYASDSPSAFEGETREVLIGVAESAELALSRQREREQLEQEVARMTTVVATGERLRNLTSRQQVYEAAVAAVLERTRATMSTLLWHEPEAEQLVGVASRRADGDAEKSFQGHRLGRGQGLAWDVLDGGRTLHVSDASGLQKIYTCSGRPPASDYIGTPLRDPRNRAVGVLVASLDGFHHAFEERDIAFLEAIAQATNAALTRLTLLEEAEARAEVYAELYRASSRQAQELALLDRVRTAVARELDLDEVIRTLVTALAESFGHALVSLYWLEGSALVLRHQVGYASERALKRLPMTRGVMARSVRSETPLLVADVSQDPDFEAAHDGVVSEIAVPIRSRGATVGVLNVESRGGMKLDEADLKLLVALGEQVGIALERALLHADVQQSEQRFRLLAENMSDLVCLHAPDGELRYVSPSSEAVLGLTPEALLGQRLGSLVHPDDLSGLRQEVARSLQTRAKPPPFTFRLRHHREGYRWFEIVTQPLHDDLGRLQGFTSASRDVTERQGMEERLRFGAYYDALTQLPNRAFFLEGLERALALQSGTTLTAVLFLDLNRFKLINDSLGHQAGDALLRQFSARLLENVRPGDTVARLGGDEFCVLLEHLAAEADAFRVAERLCQALEQPFDLDGREVFASASIGIAFASGSEEADGLLRSADIAMYQAKHDRAKHHAQGAYRVFDQTMHRDALERLTLETDLRRAVERGELRLHYQPIFDLQRGELRGFEALSRWRRQGVNVPPDLFIPLAEETGLITQIDAWVLQEACRQLSMWRQTYDLSESLGVSVNLSSLSFERSDLTEVLWRALEANGLPSTAVTLELTERTVMRDAEAGVAVLYAIRELGVQVQIDDFGTGYSSLQYLHSLPLDSLKIDRSFVAQLGSDQPGAVVRSILALARQLGLQVVAEGIETPEQLECLRALGCDYGQGYLLSKPLPPEALEATFLRPKALPPVVDRPPFAMLSSGD